MADMSWQNPKTQPGAESAVLDMEMDDGRSDVSDYDNQFEETTPQKGPAKGGDSMVDNLKQKMGENVTQMVWQAGTQSARRAWSLYGNIDVLRPYFNVEPKEVQMRLIYSLIPLKPTDQRISVPKELYGPLMVVLTLIALLLYQMKSAEHVVEEGTLMGSAFGVCFMYWFGASSLVWFMSYACNVRLAILQILSMMGYALFGHCIVLFLGTAIHTSHDHMFFYLLWAAVGGLASLRMATIIMSRTRGRTERLIVIGTIVCLHLLFLLYLHFAYHTIVEELSHALSGDLVPAPAMVVDLNAPVENEKDTGSVVSEDNLQGDANNLADSLAKVPGIHPAQVVSNAINETVEAAGRVTLAMLKQGSNMLDKLKPGITG